MARPKAVPRAPPSELTDISAAPGVTLGMPLYDPLSFADAADADAVGPVEPPSEEELAEFKQKVSDWAKMDEQIKKLSVAMRERRVHQKAMGAQIQEFMERFRYDDLNTRSGIIRHNVRTVPVPLKVKDIQQRILEVAGEEAGADLLEKIFNSERPTVEKRSLRRIVPKVSMSLDI